MTAPMALAQKLPPKNHLSASQLLPERSWNPSDEDAKNWGGPFASALRIMMDGGLPDPIGLPYHKVTLVTGNCYSGYDGANETEAWLLPDKGDKTAYAIAWNGLIYPIIEDIGKADLKKSVELMIDTAEEDRGNWFDTGEATQVSLGTYSLIHGLYLTRLGFPEAAKQLLDSRERPLTPPLLESEIALQWIWNHYERAVCAHMRGDPALVLASLSSFEKASQSLAPVIKKSEQGAGFLESWEEGMIPLRKESTLRLKEGKSGWLDLDEFLGKDPDVTSLIEALARIAIPQAGQPADVPLWESKIVKTLVARGKDAMDPLLTCLENDDRLTQSVHFWRNFHRSRTILGVHEAALYALQDILGKSFFVLASTGDSLSSRDPEYRKKLAEVIRKDWEKYDKTTGVERAFRILKDDDAGIEGWWDAGAALFPVEEYDEKLEEWVLPPGPIPGEVLRKHANPSVSDLLERRAEEAGKMVANDDQDTSRARLVFLSFLLEWDSERGTKAIKSLTLDWLKNQTWQQENPNTLMNFVSEVVDDVPEALSVMEAMIWKMDPSSGDSFSDLASYVTENFVKYGSQFKRDGLWTAPQSPWCVDNLNMDDLESVCGAWQDQEVTTQPPFRELLLKLLADDTSCGTGRIEEDDPEVFWIDNVDGNGASGSSIPEGANLALEPGETIQIRRKDLVARTLKTSNWLDQEKETILQHYWPTADRNRWVERVREELKNAPEPKKKPTTE